MSRYGRDPDRIAKDLLIAFRCDRYADVRPLSALREMKRERGEWV